MNLNELKRNIKLMTNNPETFICYAGGVSMLLYTMGYFIRAIKK